MCSNKFEECLIKGGKSRLVLWRWTGEWHVKGMRGDETLCCSGNVRNVRQEVTSLSLISSWLVIIPLITRDEVVLDSVLWCLSSTPESEVCVCVCVCVCSLLSTITQIYISFRFNPSFPLLIYLTSSILIHLSTRPSLYPLIPPPSNPITHTRKKREKS